jgi:hypothetical protein
LGSAADKLTPEVVMLRVEQTSSLLAERFPN